MSLTLTAKRLLAPALLAALGACSASVGGAGGAPPAGQTVAVEITPGSITLAASQATLFAVQVTGTADTSVTWQVQEANGGTIDESGRYTAPGAAGTYHVRAVSGADPKAADVATVTVAAAGVVTVAITPASLDLDACASRTFAATVGGSGDPVVTWKVVEAAGGQVTSGGVYTAPSTPGVYHLSATAHASSAASSTVAITVRERVLSVTVDPPSASVAAGGTQQYTAMVTTTCGTFAAN